MRNKILIIEDNKLLRESISKFLKFKRYTVHSVEDMQSAEQKIALNIYDVFLLDIGLPDGDGITLYKKNKKLMKNKTIIMTGNNKVDIAVNAIKQGVYDYLEKPVKMDRLYIVIKKALELNSVKGEVISLKQELSSMNMSEDIIYESKEMQNVINMARDISKTEHNVLIMGETGVGKDKVARYIHNNSNRYAKVFLEINCATLMDSMIVPELFGYKKGAFTGADSGFQGRFKQADKGTLFLNEIGELPIDLQPHFLSVIENKTITSLGEDDVYKSDFRLISATNRSLNEEIIKKNFRSDFYFRLKEFVIHIPPLRERKKDILILYKYFIKQFCLESKISINGITKEAEDILFEYNWPGNVRELKQIAKIAVIKMENDIIDGQLIENILDINEKWEDFGYISLKEYSDNYIRRVLSLSNNNINKTAKTLKISRNRIYKILSKN